MPTFHVLALAWVGSAWLAKIWTWRWGRKSFRGKNNRRHWQSGVVLIEFRYNISLFFSPWWMDKTVGKLCSKSTDVDSIWTIWHHRLLHLEIFRVILQPNNLVSHTSKVTKTQLATRKRMGPPWPAQQTSITCNKSSSNVPFFGGEDGTAFGLFPLLKSKTAMPNPRTANTFHAEDESPTAVVAGIHFFSFGVYEFLRKELSYSRSVSARRCRRWKDYMITP